MQSIPTHFLKIAISLSLLSAGCSTMLEDGPNSTQGTSGNSSSFPIGMSAPNSSSSSSSSDNHSSNSTLGDVFSDFTLPTLEYPTSNLSRFTGYYLNNTDTSRTITLIGRTENSNGDSGVVEVINSMGKTVTQLWVSDGEYQQAIEIAEGRNLVRVTIYLDGRLVESGEFEINSNRQRIPVRVRLQWDQNLADVDLWMLTPKGRYVWYGQREAPDGTLDIDDTDGYGPETISLLRPDTGTYEVFVNLYDAHGQTNLSTAILLTSFNEGVWDTVATEIFSASDADYTNQRKRLVHSFSVAGATPLVAEPLYPEEVVVDEEEDEVVEEEILE